MANGKLYATTVSGVEMIETIKSSGAENGFFKKWAGYQASLNSQAVAQEKTDDYKKDHSCKIQIIESDFIFEIVGYGYDHFTEGKYNIKHSAFGKMRKIDKA